MSMIIRQELDGSGTLVANGVDALRVHEGRGAYTRPSQHVQFFDDFLGDALDARWSGAAGSGATAPVFLAEVGGRVRLSSGTTTVVSESLSSLTHALTWAAANGGLYLEARVKLGAVANTAVFIGFTNAMATTTLQEPITLSGVTITANAANAVGFLYDTAATNDFWHLQGVKASTATAVLNTGNLFTAATYQTFGLEVDTLGHATFFIDGVRMGSVANAVTAATPLTPIITCMSRSTSLRVVDVDYIFVAQKRV